MLTLPELKNLTFKDFYYQKIVIDRIDLDRYDHISEWLDKNSHLILERDQKRSDSRWGRNVSRSRYTAYFCLTCDLHNGCGEGANITPQYRKYNTLTHEQTNQTLTMSELFFGLMKKYPDHIRYVFSNNRYDLDHIDYLKIMHPKALI